MWTGIFKNKFVAHGQYIRLATPLLISIYQKMPGYWYLLF